MGVAALPCHIADPDPVLRRVLSEPMLDGTPNLWVLYHQDAKHIARVRLFPYFLVERPQSVRHLFEGDSVGCARAHPNV